VQAVADIKEFTYYPKKMLAKFLRIRAGKTIMTKEERKKQAFQRPKRWFPGKLWKLTRKQKIFGLTTSNGKIFTCLIPMGEKEWTATKFAEIVKKRLGPFLKKAFPDRKTFQILLDGEKVFHAPEAKRAMKRQGMKVLPEYPPYSPDLNPQENVWPWAEKELRKLGTPRDTFETFQKKAQQAICNYVSPEKLVASIAKRCRRCLEKHGEMIEK